VVGWGGSYWVIERQNMFAIYWKSMTEAIGISVEGSGIMKMKYRQSSGRYQMNIFTGNMHIGATRVDLHKKQRNGSKLGKRNNIPTKSFDFRSRCTSAAPIFTQVKCVGDALKQNAG
jgi:hypothetical protein